MSEETLYEKLTPVAYEARILKAPIAYLPLGTLEWHGPHLPLGSDHLDELRREVDVTPSFTLS
jgi:creatinine amidohydrolase